MKIKISIIIPFHNRNNTINRCLSSVISKIYNVEIIIIDDGSEFKLNDSVTHIYPIKYIYLERNMGAVAARSVGAEMATGDYLLFLDSDDELAPHWDATLLKLISDDCDVYGFPSIEFGEGGVDYLIQNSFDFWSWVSNQNRAPDYWLFMRKSCYASNPMPKVRISEIWYICQIIDNVSKVKFSKFPIFICHKDAGNQLSKEKKFRFNFNAYDIDSLKYSIAIFINKSPFIKMYAPKYYYAWKKRFIKESILSLQINLIIKLLIK